MPPSRAIITFPAPTSMYLSNLVAQHTLASCETQLPALPYLFFFFFSECERWLCYESLFKISIAHRARQHLVFLYNGPLTDSSMYLKATLEIGRVEEDLLRSLGKEWLLKRVGMKDPRAHCIGLHAHKINRM